MDACLIAQQICTDTVVNTFIGAFIGAVLGALVSWRFARRSSEELREEAARLRSLDEQLLRETDRLRRINDGILRGIEKAGWIRVSRDAKGEFVGFVFELRAETGSFKTSGGDAEMHVGRVSTTAHTKVEGDLRYDTKDNDKP